MHTMAIEDGDRRASIRDNPYLHASVGYYRRMGLLGKVGFYIIVFYILIAVLAPYIAPHGPLVSLRTADGSLALNQPPSSKFPLGTTTNARDVLSQVLYGSRTSVFVGIVAATVTVFIGANLGLISGYYGGRVDDIIMRFTDLVFGLPFLPFVIVVVSIIGTGTLEIIIGISVILWRTSARVIRSEVLSIKEEQFVEELENLGASDVRILYKHVAPNVLPLIFLYAALALGLSVILEANLSFLGLGAPLSVSWGGMIFRAFQQGMVTYSWWWTFPPGILLSLFVLATFMFGRSLEMISDPELRN